MQEPVKRSGLEAAGLGIIAGAIFVAAGVVVNALRGVDPFVMFRLCASLLLGPSVMERSELGMVLLGALVNIVVSGVFGFLYGAVLSRFSHATQTSRLRQLPLGFAYGALLYLVDFQWVSRVLFPWVLTEPQLIYFLLHTLAFGVPLALMYAQAERGEHRRQLPTPA